MRIHTHIKEYTNSESLTVGIGKEVKIEVSGERQSWEIVDFGKSDISNGKISLHSPLIQAILGLNKGSKVKSRIMNNDVIIVVKDVQKIQD